MLGSTLRLRRVRIGDGADETDEQIALASGDRQAAMPGMAGVDNRAAPRRLDHLATLLEECTWSAPSASGPVKAHCEYCMRRGAMGSWALHEALERTAAFEGVGRVEQNVEAEGRVVRVCGEPALLPLSG